MKMLLSRNAALEIISALFILLFAYTGINKLIDHVMFEFTLRGHPLLKNHTILISWVLPIVELLVCILLFFPRLRKAGLYSSFAVMLIFTIYVGYMMAFVPNLPCSCGGIISALTWKQHIIFNAFFTFLGAYAIWLTKNKSNYKVQYSGKNIITYPEHS